MEEGKEEGMNMIMSNEQEQNKNNDPSSCIVPMKEECGHGVRKGFGERIKRDEWSEGAVWTLIEAYESKWVLRNRAKLKGRDWEDVARHVSARANCTKSQKTSTQCKNKVESMKKRYRSESATLDHPSSWPLYSRLDLLLRGTAPPPPDPSQPPPPPPAVAQNSHGSNGLHDDDKLAEEDGLEIKSCDHVSSKNPLDTNSSTPALYSQKDELRCNKLRRKKLIDNTGRRRKEHVEIAKSLRWLAEVMIRSEQARMDTIKEIERMRVEAEVKRGEMDLKRTEIIANTQLEIARIFASVDKDVDSSIKIGRS